MKSSEKIVPLCFTYHCKVRHLPLFIRNIALVNSAKIHNHRKSTIQVIKKIVDYSMLNNSLAIFRRLKWMGGYKFKRRKKLRCRFSAKNFLWIHISYISVGKEYIPSFLISHNLTILQYNSTIWA